MSIVFIVEQPLHWQRRVEQLAAFDYAMRRIERRAQAKGRHAVQGGTRQNQPQIGRWMAELASGKPAERGRSNPKPWLLLGHMARFLAYCGSVAEIQPLNCQKK